MADEKVTYEVAARFTGEGELRRGASEFDRLAAKACRLNTSDPSAPASRGELGGPRIIKKNNTTYEIKYL